MSSSIAQISQVLHTRASACSNSTSSHSYPVAPVRGSVKRSLSLRAPQKTTLFTQKQLSRQSAGCRRFKVQAAEVDTSADADIYSVTLKKPIQVKFTRGADGGAYVLSKGSDPDAAQIEIGDKIVGVSASFGDEMWEAANYGQVMYAMKTRAGDVELEMRKMYGDLEAMERPKTDQFTSERNGGNYGAGTQELQQKNYMAKQSLEQHRETMFNEALTLFKAGKYDEALVVFENVVGLEPSGYMGDDFSKTSSIYRISQYNVACCYSMINEVQASLEALDMCMDVGFDDYKMVRKDPSLENTRKSEDFTKLINKYDEPIFNENAFKAIKGLFGRK